MILCPSDNKSILLGAIAKVKGGKRLPKGNSVSDKETPFPYLRVVDFREDGFDPSGVKFITEDVQKKIKRYIITSDDIYISIAGTIGRVGIVPQKYSGSNLTENAARITDIDKDICQHFLMYYLRSDSGQAEIKARIVGTSQPKLALFRIEEIPVPVLSITAQRKIAAILSTYDDPIEKNNRRIKILEEMARLIYREWFVNYRFPSYEKVKMIDSSFGKIPEGWECGTLEDILVQLESGSRPKGGAAVNEEGIPSIGAENILGLGIYDYSKEKYVSLDYYNSMRRGHVESGDVLIYKDGANIGRKSLFRDSFPHVTCCINEHVFILRSNDRITQNYLFFWLELPYMTQMIRNLNANAAQPGINQGGIKGLPILIPTREVLNTFQTIVEPLCALLFNLAKRNRILQIARDHLLPRLISGEIDVSELDIDIAEEVV